jgi:hypothetical protein
MNSTSLQLFSLHGGGGGGSMVFGKVNKLRNFRYDVTIHHTFSF